MYVYRLRGLPGSGKSTFAKNVFDAVELNPKFSQVVMVVNRDTIRKQMFGYEAPNTKRNQWLEKAVTNIEMGMYDTARLNGYSVVIDNVNGFNDTMVKWLEAGYKVVDVWFETPYEECVRRAANRERVVDKRVLDGMLERYPWLNPAHEKWGKSSQGFGSIIIHYNGDGVNNG